MTHSKDDFVFNGFEPANTTPVPDVLFDELLTKLSGAELKVLLYIIRRTWGFKKDTDAISLSQFTDGIVTREGKVLDSGCGIKNRTQVSKALISLENMGCIKTDKGDDPLGDKATTLYTIRFRGSAKIVPPSAEIVPPVVTKAHYRSNQSALPVVRKSYLQETVLQETDKQDTVRQDTREREHATPTGASSLSFDASRSTQPSSYSESDTRSTMATSNTLTDEDSGEVVSQQKGHGQSQHDHNGNPGIHRSGHNRPDNGPRDSSVTPTQALEKGHQDDRPAHSIEPGNTGLPGTLASVTSQVPLLAETHSVETPPRLAVESGRVDGSHAPETPAPQPAHTGHSADGAVVGARSLPATAPYLSRQESTSKDKPKRESKKVTPEKPEFTVEGEALYRDWCSLFHVTIPRQKAIIEAANALAEPITIWAGKLDITRAEVLKRIMNWMYQHNQNYYGEGRGVKLYDIARDFEGWQSAAERKIAKDALKIVPSSQPDKSSQFNTGAIILDTKSRKGGLLHGKVASSAH